MDARVSFSLIALLLAGCAAKKEEGPIDAQLAAGIAAIRAIDNHAHPVRASAPGEAPDHEYDALPVENLEPSTDPVYMRPDAPGLADAWKALYGASNLAAKQQTRPRVVSDKAANYPTWALDQMGIDIMLANRVVMGTGIAPPRFRWVPYADALIFPLDNSSLARANSDRKAFFTLEDALRKRYAGDTGLPATLGEYLQKVVTPTLEHHRQDGAVAEKFEAAYLRSLDFGPADRTAAERAYAQYQGGRGVPPDAEYKTLQDYLFRFVAAECGRLGMAVHIHVQAGAGSYFSVTGANPLLLEPVLNDPELRKTKFVMVHGGWPFIREITPLLTKPNAYLDISNQDLMLTPATLAHSLREWMEFTPEKVLFGTDCYPSSDGMGWEESGWLATKRAREALGIALTGMMRDAEITRERALALANMVLRENARALYGL
jgi:hypothetical protein